MRLEKPVSFAIVLILLAVVMWRGASTGFATASIFEPLPDKGCLDNDLGITPSIASSAVVGSVELRDSCFDETSIFEAVCNDGKAEYVFLSCERDVSAGSKCLREGANAYCG